MSLNLGKTAQQIEGFAHSLKGAQNDRSRRLSEAVDAMRRAAPEEVRAKQSGPAAQRRFLYAVAGEGLGASHPPKSAPGNFCVLSVDGSHIDVDRHMPAACALVNIGGCVLRYGDDPDAYLYNEPSLYSDDRLYLTEQTPEGATEIPIEGAILGLMRTVEEVKALAPLIRDKAPADAPTLALLDGSLILWALAGQGYPELVRTEIIQRGLTPALDALREMSRRRVLALAAYVSLPRSREAANALRLHLCEFDSAECKRVCRPRRSPHSPCSMVNHLLDRELFEELLAPGQRSCLFSTNSSIVDEYGRGHRICFYYLHTGEEVARVEMPEWVALDKALLSLTHTLILDQTRRGMGYPVAISEAHEQAVIGGGDRRTFRELVDRSLVRRGMSISGSEKSRSKRMAWV